MDPIVAADTLYRTLLKRILFRLDAETAHRLTLRMLSAAPVFARPADSLELGVKLWGIDFANPIGLAAGMDKDAIAVTAWNSLGFGFAELGTITPRPQPGNDKPRAWRIPEHRALINRLGFPSEGMDAVAPRIERIRRRNLAIRIGLNFGPNKETPPDKVAADYAALAGRLGAIADFIVVNVSSPNTPGLREWQSPERMREIIAAMRNNISSRPVLLKLAPDLEPADLFRICDAAMEIRLDGIVATNTTVAREAVGVASSHPGGLSGRPLLEKSRAMIREIYNRTGGKMPIVGVGGIVSAEDAWGHIRAGASMVELYTGLIYEGPGLVARIKAGLAGLMKRDGFRSIGEAVGTESK
ncbi:MAG TPA: quinone-dependent dihydroorotate dehydrogenase [Candidatus Binataceae bacterium]|nr:quinone-dependent dihydroorotate dehydrogenase [Candidatus Binataceae bacterium]